VIILSHPANRIQAGSAWTAHRVRQGGNTFLLLRNPNRLTRGWQVSTTKQDFQPCRSGSWRLAEGFTPAEPHVATATRRLALSPSQSVIHKIGNSDLPFPVVCKVSWLVPGRPIFEYPYFTILFGVWVPLHSDCKTFDNQSRHPKRHYENISLGCSLQMDPTGSMASRVPRRGPCVML
jgi:hypothetical protein